MKQAFLVCAVVLALVVIAIPVPAGAQDSVYPLPAPLFILDSAGTLLRIDPADGAQTPISNPNQPVADFDIAPDGNWVVFRTAAEGMVIVGQIAGQSGYVLEFESAAPPPGPAQTIAWSPDGAALAYIVADGVRLAYPGAGAYGEAQFGHVQGDWHELYWEALEALIVSDAAGNTTRISGGLDQWTVAAAPDLPARPQPVVPSYLTGEGVVLGDQAVVPGTAGAVAFDWGPLPPTQATGYMMPANLYYIAPGPNGIDQVWRLPRDGSLPQQVTNDPDPVTGYGISPDETQIAYVAGDALLVQDNATSDLAQLALLEAGSEIIQPRWSPDGTRVAYHDLRGVWVVLADGTQSPRIVARSTPFNEQTTPGDVRFYHDPRWSPDGSRLLAGVGLWEGAILGVLDLATDTLTELPGAVTNQGRWTSDGRVLAWSSFYAYSEPGLFLLDPAQPESDPVRLIDSMAVYDAVPGPAGNWYALVNDAVQMGPTFLRVWQAASLDSSFGPVFPAAAGGFASFPQLATDGSQFIIAGVHPQTENDTVTGSGDLRLIDVAYNTTLGLTGPSPAHMLQWGPTR